MMRTGETRLPALMVAAIVVMTLALGVWNAVSVLHCDGMTGYVDEYDAMVGCVDEYWLEFWLVSYEDGHTRRALIGSLVRFFAGDEVFAWQVNLAAFAVSFALLLLVGIWLHRLAPPRLPFLMPIVLTGPSMTLLFETTGDPMQVAAVLVLLAAFVPGVAGAVVALAALLAAALVHEASLFLLAPVMVVLAKRKLGLTPRLPVIVVVLLLLVAVALLFSNQGGAEPGTVLIGTDGAPFTPRPVLMKSFRDLLAAEWDFNFGSTKQTAKFFYKLGGAFVWPLALALILSALTGSTRLLRNLVVLIALSLPLYVIAHDWGRFAMFSFYAALPLSAMGIDLIAPGHWPGLSRRVGAAMDALVVGATPLWLIAFALIYHPNINYRLTGLHPVDPLLFLGLLAFAFHRASAAGDRRVR